MERGEFFISDHDMQVSQSRSEHRHLSVETNKNVFSSLCDQLEPLKQRSLLRIKSSLSAWLHSFPIQKDHFDLTVNEFRDSLCLRYMKPLQNLPPNCEGCGQLFTTSHALDCKKEV